MMRLKSVSISISSYILALDISQEQMYFLSVLKKKKKNGTKEIKAIRKCWRDFEKEAQEINPVNSFRAKWNGTPIQYPCLENPMGGGAWWAAVHGVAKSRTRLSDFTFTFHFPLSCIGGGNGNPLQCSCLENPRDRGAWWAAVYGVAQSRTQLKRLSSSSSSRAHLWHIYVRV